jgi:hypothetical protein
MAILDDMWAGLAYEVGGEIVVGTSYQKGTLFSLFDPASQVQFCTFQQQSISVGAGLGGAYSRSFVVGLNIGQPTNIDGAEAGFDFSLDAAIAGLGKYVRSIPDYLQFYYEFEEGIRRYLFQAGKAIELADKHKKLQAVLSNYKGIETIAQGKPTLVLIPIGSIGLRISVKYKFTTTEVLSWGTRDFSKTRSAFGALRSAYSPL